MDCGAHGVIVADVRTYDEAKNIVDSVKYPPRGKRGVGLFKAQHYGKKFDEYKKWLLEESFIIPQIEHFEAIKNLKDILSLKDIDGIMVGPYDLSASMNLTEKFKDQKFLDAISTIKDKASRAYIPCGVHIVEPDKSELEKKIDDGYKFIPFSIDSVVLEKFIRNPIL